MLSIFRHPARNLMHLKLLFAIMSCLVLLLATGIPATAQDMSITTESLAGGTVNVDYSQTLEASGGTPPYTWGISGGSLPAWAELNAETGVISGTPNISGTTIFTVQVSDSAGSTAEKSLSLVINKTVTITTFVLQSGAEGNPYSQTLLASGGTGTYTWTRSDGTLPAGLALNSSGRISGTPSRAGLYNFTVKVTDSSSNSATRTLTIAVLQPGYLYTWGDNSNGQLGNNSTTSRNLPVQPSSITDDVIFHAAAGGLHSLAVDSDGDVWAWGDNAKGQLGIGSTTDKSVPQRISQLSDIIAVSAGYQHSLALEDDGTVWAWGDNTYGQLGIDSSASSLRTPEQVEGLENIVAISCGYYHSLALKADGSVWAWGYNNKGQLGNNSTTISRSPVPVRGIGGTGYLAGIVAISAGNYHNLALNSEGGVLAWGDNSKGQLGNNSTTAFFKNPVAVDALEGEDIVALAAGGLHSLAVDSNGDVWAWGYNAKGQLGIGSVTDKRTPAFVRAIGEVTAIAAGDAHSLAIDEDGRLWACGDNAKGQLGIGAAATETLPERVDDFTSPLFAASGTVNTMAISEDELQILEDLTITTASLPDGKVDKSYSQTLKATGGSGDYEWTRSSGTLPPGLSLNASTGRISGTPSKAGTYTFKIKVTDSDNSSLTATASFTIEIDYSATISITTASLPDGAVDKSYSQTLKATGGSGDYEWRSSGTLPPGLSLNASTGKISGTPSKAGNYTFKIKVTDNEDDSLTATASFTIEITGGTDLSPINLNGLNSSQTIQVDKNGATGGNYQVSTKDNNVTLAIPGGSRLLDSEGKPLTTLSAGAAGTPPAPPINAALISAYNFGPDGASFSPPITIYFKYKEADLPAGVEERNLYLALYDTRWQKIASTVDTNANTVAAVLSHFSTYAILADKTGIPTEPTSQITPTGTSATPTSPTTASNWWVILVIIAMILVVLFIALKLMKNRRYGAHR